MYIIFRIKKKITPNNSQEKQSKIRWVETLSMTIWWWFAINNIWATLSSQWGICSLFRVKLSYHLLCSMRKPNHHRLQPIKCAPFSFLFLFLMGNVLLFTRSLEHPIRTLVLYYVYNKVNSFLLNWSIKSWVWSSESVV